MTPHQEELLACYVHGSLAALHLLAAGYNYLEDKRGWAAFHAIAAALDTYAVIKHRREYACP